MPVVEVSPFRCRLWVLHDRLEEHVKEETCKSEIDSFLANGQIVPTLGRPTKCDPNHDVELICGARRLFVARHLNQSLLVDLRDLSDREAIIAMDVENRLRIDISPYERGMSYRRWLHAGYFESQSQIARELSISESQVSRLLKLARLPAVIVGAFASPMEIREEWGLELADALGEEKQRRAIIEAARRMTGHQPRRCAKDVFQHLLSSSARGRAPKSKRHDEVVVDNGEPLFRIRQLSNSTAVLLPLQRVSAECLKEIKGALCDILRKNPPLGGAAKVAAPQQTGDAVMSDFVDLSEADVPI